LFLFTSTGDLCAVTSCYKGPLEIPIHLQAKYVPVALYGQAQVKEAKGKYKSIVVPETYPVYLLPSLQATLKSVDLHAKLVAKDSSELNKKADKHIFNYEKGKSTNYEVSCLILENSMGGDIYLLTVTANYPATGKLGAKSVQFLELLQVSK
jgi:hypothetical protein